MTKKTELILSLLVLGTKITEELKTKVLEALENKKSVINLDEVRKVDAQGNVTELKCSVSGVWLPATEEYFYVDKKNGKNSKNFNGLLRRSRQAERIYKAYIKTVKDAKAKIWSDFEANKIDAAKAKDLMKSIPTAPDYSKVTRSIAQKVVQKAKK